MSRRPHQSLHPSLPLLHDANSINGTDRQSLRVAGLFAGIGGLELGLSRAGHSTSLLCEIEPGAIEVLTTRLPGIHIERDICTLSHLPPDVDLVAAGFPCQDLSQAGKTAGIGGSRSGLVAHVFRLIEQRRVPWILLENVPFMLQLGRGAALGFIVTELERLGYAWAYRVVDTRAFGLPQRRERVFLLASISGDPRDVLLAEDAAEGIPCDDPQSGDVACGFFWTEGIRGLGWAVNAVPTLKGGSTIGIPSPPAILLQGGEIVTPNIRDAERLQGFEPDWTLPATRCTRSGHRWKLVGNAVSVPVATWIGERLRRPLAYSEAACAPIAPGRPWPRAAWNVGNGRYASRVSSWPVARPRLDLHSFLAFPTADLSHRAAKGFLERTQRSQLRFPDRLIPAVERLVARSISHG